MRQVLEAQVFQHLFPPRPLIRLEVELHWSKIVGVSRHSAQALRRLEEELQHAFEHLLLVAFQLITDTITRIEVGRLPTGALSKIHRAELQRIHIIGVNDLYGESGATEVRPNVEAVVLVVEGVAREAVRVLVVGLRVPCSVELDLADEGDTLHKQTGLGVGVDQVRHNFERYGLFDDQVQFLVGWFKDTLPAAPIERLAVLRLDGDMYGSTVEALEVLYPNLSPGGYVIVDDYGAIAQCKEAVTDFRTAHDIIDPMEWVDWTGVYWQRSEG